MANAYYKQHFRIPIEKVSTPPNIVLTDSLEGRIFVDGDYDEPSDLIFYKIIVASELFQSSLPGSQSYDKSKTVESAKKVFELIKAGKYSINYTPYSRGENSFDISFKEELRVSEIEIPLSKVETPPKTAMSGLLKSRLHLYVNHLEVITGKEPCRVSIESELFNSKLYQGHDLQIAQKVFQKARECCEKGEYSVNFMPGHRSEKGFGIKFESNLF